MPNLLILEIQELMELVAVVAVVAQVLKLPAVIYRVDLPAVLVVME
jgi:hypothetical protein